MRTEKHKTMKSPQKEEEQSKKAATHPTVEQLRAELRRVRHKSEYGRTLRGTVSIIVVVAAVAVLIATMFLPVLQVVGTSMEPTMESGQIVLALKNKKFKQGEVVAFYFNNKILLKRVIGSPGDWIDIKEDGTVFVNNVELEEPYLSDKSLGQCEITFPYQVPDGKIFVLGDHRGTSVDSRSLAVGCIAEEFIVGKVEYRVWPLKEIGKIY